MDKNSKLTIICLPYAGGNKFSYKIYNSFLPEFIQLHTVDYPGHLTRMKEPLFTDIHLIVEDVYKQIKDLLTEPYAIYGHSMGALMGYLLTKIIMQKKKQLPAH